MATKKATPKASPLKTLTVEAWVEQKTTGWQRDALLELRTLLRAAAPKMTESIKWAQPVFDSNGPVAFMRAASKHVTLGFWRGALLDDPKGVLEGDGTRMKHLKFGSLDAIDGALVKRFMKQAVKLNAEQGDPTKAR